MTLRSAQAAPAPANGQEKAGRLAAFRRQASLGIPLSALVLLFSRGWTFAFAVVTFDHSGCVPSAIRSACRWQRPSTKLPADFYGASSFPYLWPKPLAASPLHPEITCRTALPANSVGDACVAEVASH